MGVLPYMCMCVSTFFLTGVSLFTLCNNAISLSLLHPLHCVHMGWMAVIKNEKDFHIDNLNVN